MVPPIQKTTLHTGVELTPLAPPQHPSPQPTHPPRCLHQAGILNYVLPITQAGSAENNNNRDGPSITGRHHPPDVIDISLDSLDYDSDEK